MAQAVDRLFQARERAESIVILETTMWTASPPRPAARSSRPARLVRARLLPNRMDEGYGLSRDGVENCLKKYAFTLLLAVDCGSTAVETIAWLGQSGVEVIVLDHHQVSSPAPRAVAVVNPHVTATSGDQPAASGNFQELCSAGLAFKLAHALVKRGRETSLAGAAEFDLKPLLDLVALGTIADLVPLTGENRILVTAGLERLNLTRRPGWSRSRKSRNHPPNSAPTTSGFNWHRA